MSDPQPPAWRPENDQTRPYGAPPPPPLPQYTSRPPQYGQPPYGQQPQYGQPQYGQYGAPPPHQPYPGGPHYPPPRKRKTPWVVGVVVAVVLALVGSGVAFLATRSSSDDAVAGDPMPTATYSDGLSGGTPLPTPLPSSDPSSNPPASPAPTPTPERRRTLKDIDEGIQVYDDVYVKPAKTWVKDRSTQYTVTLGSPNRPGAVMVVVNPAGYPARVAVGAVAQSLIAADRLKGAKKGSAKTQSPANSNIQDQAQLSYSGRFTADNGGTFTLVARCTTMTGVESIHNVTVTVCIAARKDAQAAVFRDGEKMLASVARSI